MEFTFSKHALEEIVKRKIPILIVEMILQQPEQIIEEDGLRVYQGTFIADNNKTYLLRAYVNDLVEPNKVVTVYFTSKIRKYRSSNNGS